MNIYTKKQKWKLVLMLIAGCIVAISLIYTNTLVSNLSKEEERKAKLWAESIEEKSKFVLYTNNLFDQIEQEERKNGELWAKASKSLSGKDNGNLSFIFEVVRNNETVPVILTDQNYKPVSNRNVEGTIHLDGFNKLRDSVRVKYRTGSDTVHRALKLTENTIDSINQYNTEILKVELEEMRRLYPPIEIQILGNKRNFLFYKDSYIFAQLKTARDDLINSFTNDIIKNSANVPVVYVDSLSGEVLDYGNFESDLDSNKLDQRIADVINSNVPIKVQLSDNDIRFIYYEESFLLTQLRYYPYIQFIIIGIFLIVAYLLFSTSRKAEQNQVWVGMAKETAHQLGTPLSSLLAWLELLKAQNADATTIHEIEKDVNRLETITERFSKIGSVPKLEDKNVYSVLNGSIEYLRKRLSNKVELLVEGDRELYAKMNVPLFEWVIENLSKNAVDAMSSEGSIRFSVSKNVDKVIIDIADTGNGIPKSKFKKIFKPGFTSKKRGWGLGLTLVKRIVENYHNGTISVFKSSIKGGTTFRIVLHTSDTK